MGMLGMLGTIGTAVVVLMIPFLMMGLVIPLVIYLVARWRNEKATDGQRDPQIGLKVVLYMLQVVGFQLGLSAVFLFLLGIISEMPTVDLIRMAIGIGLPSAGLFFAHKKLAAKTNTVQFPNIRNMFQGWNLLITAIPGFASFLILSVVIFADLPMEKGDVIRLLAPYVLTFGGAWIVLSMSWFRSAGLLPQGPAAGSFPPQGGQPAPGYPQAQQPPQPQAGYPQQQAQPQQAQAPQAQAQPQQAGYPQQAQPQAGYPQPQAQPQQAQAQPQAGYPQQGVPPAGGYPPQK